MKDFGVLRYLFFQAMCLNGFHIYNILQVGKFIQLTSTFIGGFVVAFVQGWLLTLVMLATIPPLVVAGGIMSTVISKMASRGQAAYGEAAVVVEQTIGSIRTVSFTLVQGQEDMVDHCIFKPIFFPEI